VVAFGGAAIANSCIDSGGNGGMRDDGLTGREKPGLVFREAQASTEA
jgi:hypothetical protein